MADIAPWLDPHRVPRILERSQAVRLGFSPRMIEHRLSTGAWRRVLPRTYLTVDTFTWLDRQRAALAFAGTGAVLTGAAALADLGLRSVRRPDSILVLTPPYVRLESTGFVRIRSTHRTPELEMAPGPRRASVARAAADLALERRRVDDVRALVAEVVQRRLCTVEELALELDSGPRKGSAHLRQAIAEVAGNAWSAPEARAATLLRRAGVPPFEQNPRIELPNGRWCHPDFLWRELSAVLEIDSRLFHSLPPDADETEDRHVLLETLGFSVVHRTPAFVWRQPARFVSGIVAWLDGRATVLSR